MRLTINRIIPIRIALLLGSMANAVVCHAAVVINEIHYHDADTPFDEFIELHNPGSTVEDLSGAQFTSGVRFTFPDGTLLEPGAFLVLAQQPESPRWQDFEVPIHGPWSGNLSDSSDELVLRTRNNRVIESVAYTDYRPWPAGPDGYGPSLERISPTLPANDFHSWLASEVDSGTPGAENSVIGFPAWPRLLSISADAAFPEPDQPFNISAVLDFPINVQQVSLRWQAAELLPANAGQAGGIYFVRADDDWRFFRGRSNPGWDWYQQSFNDDSWEVGPGGFGFGDDDDNTELHDMEGQYLAVFIRKSFQVENPTAIKQLILRADYDDGFAAYLNGDPIANANLPLFHSWDGRANGNHEAGNPEDFELPTTALRVGTNVLAIQIHNVHLGSTDFSAIFDLLGTIQATSGDFDTSLHEEVMEAVPSPAGMARYTLSMPAFPAGTVLRTAVKVLFTDGSTIQLPHFKEPRPVESILVPPDYMESRTKQIYLSTNFLSHVVEPYHRISCTVIYEPESDQPQFFDAVRILFSRNGQKLKFVKNEEYQGNRTLNVTTASPTSGTTSGHRSGHYEYLAFGLFREAGVLAPAAEYCRVYNYIFPSRGFDLTLNCVIQQPNERFLDMNGLDSNANIFKYTYQGHTNQTNPHLGLSSMYQFLSNLYTSSSRSAANRAFLRDNLDINNTLKYMVLSIYLTNWDGFHNNFFLYEPTSPNERWLLVPWDMDKTFGFTDGNSMFTEMPLDFGLTGQSWGVSREPGIVSKAFCLDPELYRDFCITLKREITQGRLRRDRLRQLANNTEALLLEEWDLMQSQFNLLGNVEWEIQDSYNAIRTYIDRRDEFLRQALANYPISEGNILTLW